MNIVKLTVCTASLALPLLGLPAHAGDKGTGWDYKNYAGAGCLAALAADTGLLDRGTNLIQNSSSPIKGGRAVRVMCPIVRDSATAAKAIDASVTASPGVECTLYSADAAGKIIASVNSYSYEDFNPGSRKLYFWLAQSQVAFDGTFAFRCTINPAQAIYAYNLGELADSTDYGT